MQIFIMNNILQYSEKKNYCSSHKDEKIKTIKKKISKNKIKK